MEIDNLILDIANEVDYSENVEVSCQMTLRDYRSLEEQDISHLRMIAWDRS